MTPDEQASADKARKANAERVAKERRTRAQDYPATIDECKEIFESILQANEMLYGQKVSPTVESIKTWKKDEYHPSTKPTLKGTWNKAARRLVELQTVDTGNEEQPVATAIDAEREGPTEPNNWIDGSGKKIETFLPPKAYMLLKTVWGGTNKTASFDLIYKDVFDDALTEVSSILDHQKLVRKFLQPLDYTMKTDSTQRHCFIKSISQLQ